MGKIPKNQDLPTPFCYRAQETYVDVHPETRCEFPLTATFRDISRAGDMTGRRGKPTYPPYETAKNNN